VVVGEVPQEPPAFQPRPGLVERLTGAGSGVSVVVAVTGLRGVGKTQIAAAVARARINAGWRLVAWVDAEQVESAVARLGEVAAALGLEVSGGVEAALTVRHFLEVDGERCLLVLDNVTDVDGVRRFLPAAGEAQVVVTSTSQAVEVLGRRVAVEEFTPEEAVAYLVERTGRDDSAGASALAEVLGWLPLALAQAAAVIAGQRLSYDRYMKRLRSVRIAEALRPVAGDGYSVSTAQAIVLSVEGLTDPDGLARAVLELISMLAPVGVQRGWLYRAAELGLLTSHTEQGRVPVETVDDVLGRLAELSLVTISETASLQAGGERVVVHRLVMRVVREQAAQDDRFRWTSTADIRLLTDQLIPMEVAWQDPVGVEELVQQITALTDHLPPETWHANPPDRESTTSALSLRTQAQWYLNHQETFPARAISFGQHLTADHAHVLGDDHPGTLASRNDLASAYRTAGDLARATPLFEQTNGPCTDAAPIGEPVERPGRRPSSGRRSFHRDGAATASGSPQPAETGTDRSNV
jgi:hypothetical protein